MRELGSGLPRTRAARVILAVVLASTTATIPAAARGQTAEYARRVDSLVSVVRQEEQSQVQAGLAARRRLPTDTVRVGTMIVLTDARTEALTRRSVTAAWPDIERTFGSRVAALASTPFILRDRPDSALRREAPGAVDVGTIDTNGIVRDVISDYADARTLANDWRVGAARVLSRALQPELRQWLDGGIGVDSLDNDRWTRARIRLVTTNAAVARDCFRGVAHRCAEALALVPIDDPLRTWYDAAERRELIRQNERLLRRGDMVPAFDRCAERGIASACDSIARLVPAEIVGAPIGIGPRRMLARLAIDMGGPGAFDRMASTSGTVAQQIAAAAGVPADSVVAVWRARTIAARTTASSLSPTTALTALFWASLCGALSLRSSRWR